jgi:hypothetical protein
MKHLILALCLAFSSAAMASGKLTLKSVGDAETNEYKYSLGLAVYERFAPPMAYIGWYGLGEKPAKDEQNWFKTEQGLEFYAGPVAIGLGFHYKVMPNKDQLSYYGSVGATLW